MFSLPSRGRPHNLARFLEAYRQTKATAPVRLRLDQDDPDLDSYYAIEIPQNWERMARPRSNGANPAHAELFAEKPDLLWYGLIADDVIPRTPEWDQILIDAAGRDKLAYADDGFQGEKLATHPVIGGDMVRSIGWLVCPDLGHSYADTALHLIAQKTGRCVYRGDVLLEHMHPLANKAQPDKTYRYAEGFVADTQRFHKWRGMSLRPIVEKLKAA